MAIAMVILGCESSQDPASPSQDSGGIMTFHAVTNLQPIDISIDGAQLTSQKVYYGSAFPSANSYTPASTGIRKVSFIISSQQQLFSEIQVEKSRFYSIFLVGDINTGVQTFALPDPSSTPASGTSLIRVVNCVPDIPSTTIFTASAQQEILYKQSTLLTVNSGSKFSCSFGDDVSNPLERIEFSPISGRIYTVVLHGLSDGIGSNRPRISVLTNKL